MTRLATLIVRHPILVLAAVLAITAFFLSRMVDFRTGEIHLRIDPAMDRLIADEGPETAFYEGVRKRFGNDETLVVAVVADEIFSADMLARIARMTTRFQAIDAVKRVVSLATAPNIRAVEGEIELDPFVSASGAISGDLARLREQALANPIYAGNLVSADGRASAIVLELHDIPEAEFNRQGIDEQVLAIAQEERGDAEVFITGAPRVKAETSRALLGDLRSVVIASIVVASIVAYCSFRTVRGVLVPLSTITIALIWTLGSMTWSGRSLNLVTTIIPPLLLSIGFAYTVYILSAILEAVEAGARSEGAAGSRAAARQEPVAHALAEISLSMAMNALTTGIGFLSCAISPIAAIAEFGIFSTVGTLAVTIVSFTFTPAVFVLLPLPERVVTHRGPSRIDALFERLAHFDIRYRKHIFAAAGVLCAVALYGVTRVDVSNDLIENFLPGAPVRVHFETINDRLGGANAFHVVVEARERDAFKQPKNLAIIADLQKWLARRPEVGSATSIVDHLKTINWAFHDNDPASLSIPGSTAAIDQLLFFGATDDLRQLVDSRYQVTRILVRARTSKGAALHALFADIQSYLETKLPRDLSGQATGNIVLVNKAIDGLSRGQGQSLVIATVSIYLIMALCFASFRIGLLALVPNFLPVLVYFGTMGLAGVELNTVTGLVACIVLGIAVDDTIHYMLRFGEEARAHGDETAGTVAALRGVGRPVTYTSLALCLGFLTLTATNLRSFIQFGALSSFTLLVAWILDVTLTPALCSTVRIVNLWDMLTLDLGPDPQRSIPFFSGLSRAQARLVALMTSLRTLPAGKTLMHTGEAGDDMLVVIDGELVVSVPRNGRMREIRRLGRGDVVGEMALFRKQRSADVMAARDSRLISLDRSALERLRKRYPRVAAAVFHNLAEILAGRLAHATDRLDLGS